MDAVDIGEQSLRDSAAIDKTRPETDWLQRYTRVRQTSEQICQPLETEDYLIQPIVEVSPPKWHLAHTSWFYETFILKPFSPGYHEYHPLFATLFNSYYNGVGVFHPRAQRGLLSRPTVAQVYDYRHHVDQAMALLWDSAGDTDRRQIETRLELGLHHEQQHQELMLMDIKNIFAHNPLRPDYLPFKDYPRSAAAGTMDWIPFTPQMAEFGHAGPGFHYDNEAPRHQRWVSGFELASRLVTNGEYLAFMADRGYEQPLLWLSDGWDYVHRQQWHAPLYWEKIEGRWWQMTLSGMRPIDEDEPVCHVSYYEADAYARWRKLRLPDEFEWELAATQTAASDANLYPQGLLRPVMAGNTGLSQMTGDTWEWTRSAYGPYPGFQADDGALGEYNGKFMANQMVLRGGCCVTAANHVRHTYRNFFYPHDRWAFSGIRLARDIP